jgi:hypothetical protein
MQIMARMAEASERAAAGGCGGGGETVPGPPLPCAMQGSDTRGSLLLPLEENIFTHICMYPHMYAYHIYSFTHAYHIYSFFS